VPAIVSAQTVSPIALGAREGPWRPMVLAGIIAASSFLDFGGLADARHFHTLYDCRPSEGAGSPGPRAAVGVAPRSPRKEIFKDGSDGRTNT